MSSSSRYPGVRDIEADDEVFELDSGVNTATSSSSTTTLSSSIKHYTYENGRRYHAFREGQYVLPNDEAEQDRLDMYHHVFRLFLGGELHTAPLESPQKILDVGTGTGAWAIDMADLYPEAEVIGNDLSPIQPKWVPPNVRFEIDDAEAPWTYKLDSFDFIHFRTLAGCFKDWDEVLRQAYKHLKPGGFVEFQDFGAELFHHSGTLPSSATSPLTEWWELIDHSSTISGRPFLVAKTIEDRLNRLGFEEISVRKEIWPLSPWPKDPKLKERGKWGTVGLLESLPAYSLALFTRVLGRSKEEVDRFNERARKQILTKGPENRFFVETWFVYCRKPKGRGE